MIGQETKAELLVDHHHGLSPRTEEYHGLNARDEVLHMAFGDAAMSLAFLSKRRGIKVREVHVNRHHMAR